MRAYVLHGVGDLRYEERPLPDVQPGWALVRVLAAGICSSDIPRIFEKGTYHFPTIPGHEFCGRVEMTGDASDKDWVGERVGVFPLIPCRTCPSCQKGQYELCENYDYIGSRRDGAFAEYVAVPVWNMIRLPEAVDDIQGALLEPASVALHAARRAGIAFGMRVCVVGTGAIGFLAGQWAKLLGAEQTVIKGRSEAKREVAQTCGLAYTTEMDQRFDCVIEAVGTKAALYESIELAAPGGTVVLLGNPDGDRLLPKDLYWRILRRQLTLTGTWNSSYGGVDSDWVTSIRAMETGKLRAEAVATHILEKEALPRGLDIMRDGLEGHCKVVLRSHAKKGL